MSCNGCRVLRKGCSDSCILRPCLQWIESSEAQGHATVFLAKFYGRSGLLGFISAVADRQRPALFKSLLFEACGRTVNPIFGAVGLMWSGNWDVCQEAVETVLQDRPRTPPQISRHAPLPSNLTLKWPHINTSMQLGPQPKRVHYAQQEMTHLNIHQSHLDGLNHEHSLHNASINQAQSETSQARIDGLVQEQMNALAPNQQGINGFSQKNSGLSPHQQEMNELILDCQEQINDLLNPLQEINEPRLHIANPAEELKKGLILEAVTIQEPQQSTGQLVAPVARRVRPPLNVEAMVKGEIHGNKLELDLSLNPHARMVNLGGMKLDSNFVRVSSPSSNSAISEDSAATSANTITTSSWPRRTSSAFLKIHNFG